MRVLFYLVPLAGSVLLAGCGDEPLRAEELVEGVVVAVEDAFLEGEDQYISSESAEALQVPPDLVLPDFDEQIVIPDLASGVSAARSDRGRAAAVLPEFLEIKLRREGTVRWLEVGLDPVSLWPHTKSFWEEQGFAVTREDPFSGILETDWLRREKIAPDAADDSYFAQTKERYLMRMEREPNAYTNIYLSRYGLEVAGLDEERKVVWQARTDANRENEMLARLMQYLGGAIVDDAVPNLDEQEVVDSVGIAMESLGDTPVLRIEEGFSSAWRQLGVAFGRAGMSVLDTDRESGTYHLRGPEEDGEEGQMLMVRLLDQGPERTMVTVHAEPGHPEVSNATARDIIRRVIAAYALVPQLATEE